MTLENAEECLQHEKGDKPLIAIIEVNHAI